MKFEIIGNKEKAVAIVESASKKIANKILKNSKNIKSVLTKTSERKGKLRKREYKLIAGKKDTEVIHREYGFLIKLDPQKTYFSPRELTERQRIAKKVKNKEKILVMFSGIAPFIVAIKKKQPTAKVYGIELNKSAHKYALENIKLNKLTSVNLIQGDVKKAIPKMKFDRILMPLPKTSNKFLILAFKKIKKDGIIHYYSWSKKEEYPKLKEFVKQTAKSSKKKIRILKLKKVLPYAPRIYKIVLDIKCLN